MTGALGGPMTGAQVVEAVAAELDSAGERPLELYVHVPFCASKCHFCDWVTDIPVHRLRSGRAERAPYVESLCRQIRYYGPQLGRLGYRPRVMYWGGGTPTRLDPNEMQAVHRALAESFDLSGLVQWSMETTPNDLTAERLEAMCHLGVNRVSVGVQSLDREQLRRAGRAHGPEQALAAVGLLRSAGIENFNVDLISSFPGERGTESLAATLDGILALDPPHVSVYPYRATPKTVMAMQLDRDVLRAWDVGSMIEAYELAMARLTAAGYHEYCHGYWVRRAEDEDQDGNYKYDLAGDKIAFGSGTESVLGHHLLLNPSAGNAAYLADPTAFQRVERFSLDRPETLTALVGGALMTREGVDYGRFHALTGFDFLLLRRTPHFTAWLRLLEECGGRFLENERGFMMERSSIHRAYIRHLAYTMSHGLALARG